MEIGGIVAAIVTMMSAVAVALIARNANRGNTTVEFAKAVVSRLEKVEDDLAEVKTTLSTTQEQLTHTKGVLTAAVWFIERLVDWGKAGAKRGVPTPPRELHEYLNLAEWNTPNQDPSA